MVKKLTRQSRMKVDPQWLLTLADSLRFLANQLDGGPVVVEKPTEAVRHIAAALQRAVEAEYKL